jgi:hypothetical protein
MSRARVTTTARRGSRSRLEDALACCAVAQIESGLRAACDAG